MPRAARGPDVIFSLTSLVTLEDVHERKTCVTELVYLSSYYQRHKNKTLGDTYVNTRMAI